MEIRVDIDGGGTYWCATGGKQQPYNVAMSGDRVLQIEQPFRSETVKVRPRKNRQVSVEFSVDKEYASVDDAVQAAMFEEAFVPFAGTLVVKHNSEGKMVGSLQSISVSQVGVTLRFRYRFVGEGFTTAGGEPIEIQPI